MTDPLQEDSNSEYLDLVQRLPVRGSVVLFTGIAALVLVDVIHDAQLGAELEHLVIEGILMILATAGAWLFWRFWLAERVRARAALAAANREVKLWQAEADRWRGQHKLALEGLGVAIDQQFERWKLSAAEKEVAMLLLKGLSHREVADVRSTSERTARQQARGVYKKAELAGRAELAALFLEDLLLPPG